jgi:hypothetical protein
MARDDVEVHPVPHKTRGYVLHLFHEGRYIGEYEDSRAGDEDRKAKIQEAIGASELLLNACSQSSTCMIAVRWNSKMKGKDREKAKQIREYGLCLWHLSALELPLGQNIPSVRRCASPGQKVS